MKSKALAAVFALILGGFGVHKFYLGRIGWGIAYLLFCWTFIPSIIGLVEFFILIFMPDDEFNFKYNKTQFVGSTANQTHQTAPPPVNVNITTTDHFGRQKVTTVSEKGWSKFRTNVAGFQYHDGPQIEDKIKPGTAFQLVREPDNEYDPNAVKVMLGRYWIGYVPKEEAPEVAEAMDNGEHIQAICARFNPKDADFHKLQIDIVRDYITG